jgi:hypothetical protein
MTSTEARQLERATIRAREEALEVLGKGSTRDGRAVYAVPSRRDVNHWHLVVVSPDGKRLSCTCEAGRYSKVICAHRAAVRQCILAERQAEEQAREAADLAYVAGRLEQLNVYLQYVQDNWPAPGYDGR